MKKIVITGGLGYIGTELCKIYSVYSWNDKITIIDNRFISERVNQIRNWNMNFVQGDILDKEIIRKYCSDADIIHHLAGITDVPRVKSELRKDHDNKIMETGQKGTQNIIDAMSVLGWDQTMIHGSRPLFKGKKILGITDVKNESSFNNLDFDFLILPGWMINKFSKNSIDGFLNVRSMMEMNRKVIQNYFNVIHTSLRENGLFACINRYMKQVIRESNTTEINQMANYPYLLL